MITKLLARRSAFLSTHESKKTYLCWTKGCTVKILPTYAIFTYLQVAILTSMQAIAAQVAVAAQPPVTDCHSKVRPFTNPSVFRKLRHATIIPQLSGTRSACLAKTILNIRLCSADTSQIFFPPHTHRGTPAKSQCTCCFFLGA